MRERGGHASGSGKLFSATQEFIVDLLFVNIGNGPYPPRDISIAVAGGNGAREVMAVDAVVPAHAVLGQVGRFFLQRTSPG